MISTCVYLNDEVQYLLIKAAAIKQVSVETLASEILNTAIQEQLTSFKKDNVTHQVTKPALAGTQPFLFLGTPEESGIPLDEWEMENDYS